ncbi:hypothetical protein C8J57DRAFT_1412691, partial [Mycena rebaudengoi]
GDGFDICIEEYRHTVIPPCNNWHDRGADDTGTGMDGSAVPDQTRSSLLARGLRNNSAVSSISNCSNAMGHAAHVRDSVRYTPSRKEMNTLRLLGIVPPDFNLDDPSSLHRVNDVWHIASDKLALWSWAPCIGTVHFLLGILQTERIGRQAYYQQHKKAPWRKWNPTVSVC